MSFSKRSPCKIALDLLEKIREKDNKASKWDLLKVVGTESQFHFWVEDFLVKDKFVSVNEVAGHSVYSKTDNGEQLHKLLTNGRILKALLRVSGKRLKKETKVPDYT
jgi:predicted transcriptional regulator